MNNPGNPSKLRLLFTRFSLKDQILFAKRLATLVKAGIPILQALLILKAQMRSVGMTRLFSVLIDDVENGQYLSTSLGRFRNIFGDFAVNIINIGETSGTLYENLEHLSDELKKKQALRRKVIGSLIYPVVIVLATLGITGLLMFFVFPKVLPIFASLNFELPWTTRVLIAASNFFFNYWVWVLLGIFGLIVLFVILIQLKKFRYAMHRGILTLPIFGGLAQNYQLANLCRTMGLLLKSGVRIVQAAKITANTTMNLVYKKQLEDMAEKVTHGKRISVHMSEQRRLFPPLVSQMVAVGETSGSLTDTFYFLAEMYEHEVDELTKNLTTVIEPLLMVFMGLIVGFIAVSIITPIYEVTQSIHP